MCTGVYRCVQVCTCVYRCVWGGCLQVFQVSKRTPLLVEDEGEHVLSVLHPGTHERSHVRLPTDLQGHLTAGAGHLELATIIEPL